MQLIEIGILKYTNPRNSIENNLKCCGYKYYEPAKQYGYEPASYKRDNIMV